MRTTVQLLPSALSTDTIIEKRSRDGSLLFPVANRLKAPPPQFFHIGLEDRLWGTPAYRDSIIGIHVDAVAWMLDQGVKVYGLDNQSPDLNVVDLPNHQLLGKREHHHIENLRNLDQIPIRRFTFFGLPLNLRNATASPIRAVALVEGK